MSFTVFSFATSWLFSTLILLAVHFLRRNSHFIKGFGVKPLLLCYIACLLRIIFVPEFSFTKKWELPNLTNGFFNVLYLRPIQLTSTGTSYFRIFLCVWWAVALLFVFIFSIQYIVGMKRVKRYAANSCPGAQEVLCQVQAEYVRKMNVKVFVCPETNTPLGIGILSKYILLPNSRYSRQELYHMIKHEYTHFYNRDLAVKFLVMLFCCAFWWNPAVYLLWRDISQILEIKCDLTVTKHYSIHQKKAYLSVIVALLKDQETKSRMKFPTSVGLIKRKRRSVFAERFRIVLDAPERLKRWQRLLISSMCLSLFVLSYAVVIQPRYEPPEEEIISENGLIYPEVTGYIVKNAEGEHFMCEPGERPYPIKREAAELLASTGIKIEESDEYESKRK